MPLTDGRGGLRPWVFLFFSLTGRTQYYQVVVPVLVVFRDCQGQCQAQTAAAGMDGAPSIAHLRSPFPSPHAQRVPWRAAAALLALLGVCLLFTPGPAALPFATQQAGGRGALLLARRLAYVVPREGVREEAPAACPQAPAERPLRRIIVTPAGRERYLRLLVKHLIHQRAAFDEWHLWLNTVDASDVTYVRGLAKAHPWIRVAERPGIRKTSNANIQKFFDGAADARAMYLRLDDDVVWLDCTFVEAMFAYRETHPEPFLVYANIINNALTSHFHQRAGLVAYNETAGYTVMDRTGWASPGFAHALHFAFIGAVERGDISRWRGSFPDWPLKSFERCSINAIAWLGRDMRDQFPSYPSKGRMQEEEWISEVVTRNTSRPAVIVPSAVCAHFAFYPQRKVLDTTGVLERYSGLSCV